jgi:hypothetical protein
LHFRHIFPFPGVKWWIQTSHATPVSLRCITSFFIDFSFSAGAPSIACAQCSAAASSDVSSTAQKFALAEVPNAGKINDFYLRGAQPSNQGLAEAKKLGVSTVVNLCGWGHEVDSERKRAESRGLRYLNIPVSGWPSPINEQVAQFLAVLRCSPGHTILLIVSKVKIAPAS